MSKEVKFNPRKLGEAPYIHIPQSYTHPRMVNDLNKRLSKIGVNFQNSVYEGSFDRVFNNTSLDKWDMAFELANLLEGRGVRSLSRGDAKKCFSHPRVLSNIHCSIDLPYAMAAWVKGGRQSLVISRTMTEELMEMSWGKIRPQEVFMPYSSMWFSTPDSPLAFANTSRNKAMLRLRGFYCTVTELWVKDTGKEGFIAFAKESEKQGFVKSPDPLFSVLAVSGQRSSDKGDQDIVSFSFTPNNLLRMAGGNLPKMARLIADAAKGDQSRDHLNFFNAAHGLTVTDFAVQNVAMNRDAPELMDFSMDYARAMAMANPTLIGQIAHLLVSTLLALNTSSIVKVTSDAKERARELRAGTRGKKKDKKKASKKGDRVKKELAPWGESNLTYISFEGEKLAPTKPGSDVVDPEAEKRRMPTHRRRSHLRVLHRGEPNENRVIVRETIINRPRGEAPARVYAPKAKSKGKGKTSSNPGRLMARLLK